MGNPRVLLISNEGLAESSSNGRTMAKLLKSYDAEQIAHFYLHGEQNYSICMNCFCVSDTDALNAFLGRKVKNEKRENSQSKPAISKKKRTCFLLVLRNIVWSSFRWWNKSFDVFLEDFRPEVIIFQAGDSPFMYKIVERIRIKFQIPVILFSTENYVLKDKLFSSAKRYSPWHLLLKCLLRRQHARLMKSVSYCVYNTEVLENDYRIRYPSTTKSATIYTSSEFVPISRPETETGEFTLLYCGNLGVGRAEMLCEVAQVLLNVDLSARLIIYGRFISKEEQDMVCQNKNVIYKGIVPYEQIPELMQKSSMLLHCENPKRLKNLRTAFSTKIADSLSSGRPFLVYASRKYPFVEYLAKHQAAIIAGDSNELNVILRKCIYDFNYRYSYVSNAILLATVNHSIKNNSERFSDIICRVK